MAILSPEKYYKKPEESVAEYNARVAAESQIGDKGYASLTQNQKDLLYSPALKEPLAIFSSDGKKFVQKAEAGIASFKLQEKPQEKPVEKPPEKTDADLLEEPGVTIGGSESKSATGQTGSWITNPKGINEFVLTGQKPSWLITEPAKTQEELDLEKTKNDLIAINTKLESLIIPDSEVSNMVSGITATWNARIAEMERINKSRTAAITTTGYRTGGRYTGGIAGGVTGSIITAEEREGADRINALEAQKQQAILAAKQAQRENNYKIYVQQADKLEKIYGEQITAVKELKTAQAKKDEEMRKEQRLSDIADEVAQIIKTGITDPKDIIGKMSKSLKVSVTELKTATDLFASEMKENENIGKIYQSALNMGAPQEIKDAILASASTVEAYKAAGDYAQNASGIIGEYNKYKLDALANGQTPIDFNAYQTADANRKAKAAASATGLDSATLTKVQTIASQFDGEQAIKNYQTSAEAIDAMKSTGISPTDDISRIYAFAKVMDPNSVVREGEYATVQAYSTALLERFGLKIKRVFDNSGFLTDEARKFLLTTLENRLNSSQKAFNNIYNEYGRRIDKITGAKDGKDYLTNYSKPFISTGDKIIQNENDAETALTNYLNSNPDKEEEINQRIADAEKEAGRPLTAQEFLQIYPEYK